jgi:GTP pyrophosphokinase
VSTWHWIAKALKEACEFARGCRAAGQRCQEEPLGRRLRRVFSTGLEIAEILADLKLDQDSLVAAVLYRGVREGRSNSRPTSASAFGPTVAKLIDGVQRMAAISASLSPRQSMVHRHARPRSRTCARCSWPWSTTSASR